MSRRIVIEEPCEHGRMHRHPFGPLPAPGGVASWCPGCSRTVLTEPSDEMAEVVARVFGDAWLYRAKEALTAALFSSYVVAGEREDHPLGPAVDDILYIDDDGDAVYEDEI